MLGYLVTVGHEPKKKEASAVASNCVTTRIDLNIFINNRHMHGESCTPSERARRGGLGRRVLQGSAALPGFLDWFDKRYAWAMKVLLHFIFKFGLPDLPFTVTL